jgi:ABC-type glycerol-3-phosphate transport system substrate-binding protein
MKSRKHFKSIVLFCIAAVAVIASVFIFGKKPAYISQANADEVKAAVNLLNNSLRTRTVTYLDFLAETGADPGQGDISAQPDNGTEDVNYDGLTSTLDYKDTASYAVNVDRQGLYYLVLDYKPIGNSLADFIVNIKINDAQPYVEMNSIGLPLFWSDETKDFPVDRYGDEIAPKQVKKEDWTSLYLYNSSYNTSDPLKFYFEAGRNTITISNISGNGLKLGKIRLEAPVDNTPGYSEYRSADNGSLVTCLIPVNSIDYISKNTTQAIYTSENNPALSPHDSEYKLLNTLTWTEAGTEVTYRLEAPEDGYYQLAFHYKSPKEEFDVFSSIYIDGEIPFRELRNYAFASTGTKWANEVLSDSEGKPYEIYLTKGSHTITMHSEQEPVVRAWQYAKLMAQHVTQLDLEITKITGSGNDKERTWQVTRYIPEIPDYLKAYETLINEIKFLLQDYTPNGINSAIFSELDKAMAFIDKMAKYPDEIALYKQSLTKNRDNSVLKSVADFYSKLITQDFALDMIYVYGNHDLPQANADTAESVWNGTKTLGNTFVSDKFDIENDPEALNIWVNRASAYVDLLQKTVDTEFTPMTGIPVKISIMPDANKLVLSAAAGDTPDAALGLPSHIPFELASRGAVYDLTQFQDFWQIQGRFVPGSSVSYLYNEGVYALPETTEFHCLIYRTDIFEQIGLTTPDTWTDVTDMLPTLQRYGMNFYHNIAGGVGYKWYYQTTAQIFQNNGKLYTQDGLRTAIDQPEAVNGIQALGDLFIKYSLPKEVVSFFNSFRSGLYPIGVVTLNDYILFKNGAPELEGQWALSLYPGTEQPDGTIDRSYIANGSAGIIFKASDKREQAWDFLKWWTDYETQVDYAYTLQSTYGKAFVWLSANVEAVADSPFDQADKEIILEQIKWLRDTPRTPGQYLLERSISDIWNDMINNGTSAQVSIDERVIPINREIKKKMSELGYYDDQGNLLKSYVIRDYDWIAEQVEKAGQKGE